MAVKKAVNTRFSSAGSMKILVWVGPYLIGMAGEVVVNLLFSLFDLQIDLDAEATMCKEVCQTWTRMYRICLGSLWPVVS